MSRSSRRALLGGAACLAAAGVAGGLLVPAYGDLGDPAPVVDIVAPVVDIAFATSDLQGAARVEEDDEQVKVTLSSEVLFAKDSAKLRPGISDRLRQIADDLTAKGPGRVAIVGYTDDLGSAAHGLTLSRQRAAAVADALRPLLDRDDFAFTVRGLGERDPAVPNESEANRRLNRRVELTYRPG